MARAGAGWRGNRELADHPEPNWNGKTRSPAFCGQRRIGHIESTGRIRKDSAFRGRRPAYPLPSGDAPARMRFTNSEINQVVTRGLPCGGKNRRQEEFMKIRIAFAALLPLHSQRQYLSRAAACLPPALPDTPGRPAVYKFRNKFDPSLVQ